MPKLRNVVRGMNAAACCKPRSHDKFDEFVAACMKHVEEKKFRIDVGLLFNAVLEKKPDNRVKLIAGPDLNDILAFAIPLGEKLLGSKK